MRLLQDKAQVQFLGLLRQLAAVEAVHIAHHPSLLLQAVLVVVQRGMVALQQVGLELLDKDLQAEVNLTQACDKLVLVVVEVDQLVQVPGLMEILAVVVVQEL
jgi:hypothetical protein